MPELDIDNIFTYHRPFGTQPQRYEWIRLQAKLLAKAIDEYCPDSPEKSLAITNLRQAVMWANSSIAVNEKEPV